MAGETECGLAVAGVALAAAVPPYRRTIEVRQRVTGMIDGPGIREAKERLATLYIAMGHTHDAAEFRRGQYAFDPDGHLLVRLAPGTPHPGAGKALWRYRRCHLGLQDPRIPRMLPDVPGFKEFAAEISPYNEYPASYSGRGGDAVNCLLELSRQPLLLTDLLRPAVRYRQDNVRKIGQRASAVAGSPVFLSTDNHQTFLKVSSTRVDGRPVYSRTLWLHLAGKDAFRVATRATHEAVLYQLRSAVRADDRVLAQPGFGITTGYGHRWMTLRCRLAPRTASPWPCSSTAPPRIRRTRLRRHPAPGSLPRAAPTRAQFLQPRRDSSWLRKAPTRRRRGSMSHRRPTHRPAVWSCR